MLRWAPHNLLPIVPYMQGTLSFISFINWASKWTYVVEAKSKILKKILEEYFVWLHLYLWPRMKRTDPSHYFEYWIIIGWEHVHIWTIDNCIFCSFLIWCSDKFVTTASMQVFTAKSRTETFKNEEPIQSRILKTKEL